MASRHNYNDKKKRDFELKQEEDNEDPSTETDDKISAEAPPDQEMTKSSHHRFGNIRDGFSICIIEDMKEEYGLFVWPCSIILAEYVWQQRSRFSGVNVVELGAGTSLPGLVATKVGAVVTLTDDSSRSEVLDNMRELSNLNDLKCRVLGLTWGVWDPPVFSLHPSIILGADVLYDTSDKNMINVIVETILQRASPDRVPDGKMGFEVLEATRWIFLHAF